MRHIRSVLCGVVLAPAIWVLCAVGLGRGDAGRAIREGFTFETLGGLAILILAGAAYSFLILPRLSPTGPILAGTLFVAATVWVLVDTASFDGLWPRAVHHPGFDFTVPSRGLALLLSVPLLATAFSARRWRRFEFPITTPAPRPSAQPTAILPNHRPTPTLVASGTAATQYIATDRPAPSLTPTLIMDALPVGETTQIIPTTQRRRLPSAPADATMGGVPPAASPTAASPGGMPMPPGEATQVIPTTSREPSTVRLQPSAAPPSTADVAASAPHADEATLRIVAPTKPTTAESPAPPTRPVDERTTANIGPDVPTAVIRTTRPDQSAVTEPTRETGETAHDGPDDQPTTRLRSPADTSGEATILLPRGAPVSSGTGVPKVDGPGACEPGRDRPAKDGSAEVRPTERSGDDGPGATGEANSSLGTREAHITETGSGPGETDAGDVSELGRDSSTGTDTAGTDTASTDTAELNTAELDTAKLNTAELNTAELNTAELDTASTESASMDAARTGTAESDTASGGNDTRDESRQK